MSARDIYRRRQMHTERRQQLGPIPYRHCATLRSLYSQNCFKLAHIHSIEKGEWKQGYFASFEDPEKSDMDGITAFVMIAV